MTATAGNRQVDLSWAAADDGGGTIDHYTVRCSPACGARGGSFQIPGSAHTYPIDGLTNGRRYTFRLDASNEVGTGPSSAAVSATPTGDVPGAPTAVSARPEYGAVTVTWRAPEDPGPGITGYRVTADSGDDPDPGVSWVVGEAPVLVARGELQPYWGRPITFTVVALGNGPSGSQVSGLPATSAEVVPFTGASSVSVALTRSAGGPRRLGVSVTPVWQGREGLLTVRVGDQSLSFPPSGGSQEVDVPWDSTTTASAVACVRMDCVRGSSNAVTVAVPSFSLAWTDVATCVRAPDGGNTSERGNLWQVTAAVDLKGLAPRFARAGDSAWGYPGSGRLATNGSWGPGGGTVQGGWGPDNGRILWVEASLVVDDLGALPTQRIEGREASGCPPY